MRFNRPTIIRQPAMTRRVSLMKKIFLILFCFSLSGCFSAALSGASLAYNHNQVSKEFSDYYIGVKLQQQISNNPQLKQDGNNVAVTAFHQIVLLTGSVANQQDQQLVSQLASDFPGVLKVYNATKIGPQEGLLNAAHDSWVTTKIKSKIVASKYINPNHVQVVTVNGVVYLLGVLTHQEANIAVNASRATDGVRKIITIFYYIKMPNIANNPNTADASSQNNAANAPAIAQGLNDDA